MLLYSSAAALAGPNILMYLRSASEKSAINDLMKLVSPEKFQAAFGASMDSASELIASKTLTISKLMALVPPGTVDPSVHLYDTTMMAMAGIMTVAAISHSLVKPLTAEAANSILAGPQGKIIDVTASEVKTTTITATTNEVTGGDRVVKKN